MGRGSWPFAWDLGHVPWKRKEFLKFCFRVHGCWGGGEFLKFCFCDQPPSDEIVRDGPGRVGDDLIIDPDETRAVLFEKNEIQEKGQDVLDGVEGCMAEDVHGDEMTREYEKIYKIFSGFEYSLDYTGSQYSLGAMGW